MEGLTGTKGFDWGLSKTQASNLLWVTGGKIDILKEDDGSNGTSKFLCHAYLKFNDKYFKKHKRNAELQTHQPARLFTFVQGQSAIHLPSGFGIPILSSELFEFNYMVINPAAVKQPFDVKAKATFEYLREDELKKPLKPLFMRIVGMKVEVQKDSTRPQSHCSELGDIADAKSTPEENAAAPAQSSLHKIHKNESGFEQIYHWMVPPGKHVYHYKVEHNIFGILPFDTTVHYINAHLHPHGEFIELRDVTTNKTILKSIASNSPERSYLTKLTDFSSKKGIAIHRDHEYEMIAGYNNTTDHEIDAMAILFVYLLDKTFKEKTSPQISSR